MILKLRYHWLRWQRAWRYATGGMNDAEACQIIYDCQDTCGSWPLQAITARDIYDAARDRWRECPELWGLAYDAAASVAEDWNGNNDVQDAAETWAFDLIERYANEEGITLQPREEDHV